MKTAIFAMTIIVAALGVFFSPESHYALAQIPSYQTLENLPGVDGSVGFSSTSFSSYLNSAFKIGVTTAIILAVIMFVIGGIEYMGSDSITNKESARGKFTNSVWGLVMALGIYLFLNTINPDLVQFKLKIDRPPLPASTIPPGAGGAVDCTGKTNSPARAACLAVINADESRVRGLLSALGVAINNPPCTNVGQSNCTNVGTLPSNVLGGLTRLKSVCSVNKIQITGGTEWWLHDTHGRDKPVVDISKQYMVGNQNRGEQLYQCIKKRAEDTYGAGAFPLGISGPTYTDAVINAVFLNEDTLHMHVIFY